MPRYIRWTAKPKLTAVVTPTQAFVQSIPFRGSVRLSGRMTFAYRLHRRGRGNTKSCFFRSLESRFKNEENEMEAQNQPCLFVRAGNATRSLKVEETIRYVQEHGSGYL